jgi:ankyrin repeat protein
MKKGTISLTILLLLPLLLSAQSREVMDAYHLNQAIIGKDVELVKKLIKEGGNVNVQYNGRNALHTACNEDSYEMAELIIGAGADVNRLSEKGEGRTPLQFVVGDFTQDLAQLVELLLHSGADPNLSLNSDQLPLFVAINRGHVESVKVLLANGASTDLKNTMDQTALDYVNYLMERGASDAKTKADLQSIKSILSK